MANRSAETPFKEADFRSIMRALLAKTNSVRKKNPWWDQTILHVDLTGGPGIYDDGMIGSPVIFQEEANHQGIAYHAWMIEKDPDTARALAAALSAYPNPCGTHRVYCADHHDQAPAIAQEIRARGRTPLGVIYADDDTLMLPTEVMRMLAIGRMDLLAYVSATSHKRCVGSHGSPRLMEQLSLLGKKHIWFRESLRWSTFQSTFVLLSNWDQCGNGLLRERFHKVGTTDGNQLVEKFNRSERERKEAMSPRLPFLDAPPIGIMPNTSPIPASAPFALRSCAEPEVTASAVIDPQRKFII